MQAIGLNEAFAFWLLERQMAPTIIPDGPLERCNKDGLAENFLESTKAWQGSKSRELLHQFVEATTIVRNPKGVIVAAPYGLGVRFYLLDKPNMWHGYLQTVRDRFPHILAKCRREEVGLIAAAGNGYMTSKAMALDGYAVVPKAPVDTWSQLLPAPVPKPQQNCSGSTPSSGMDVRIEINTSHHNQDGSWEVIENKIPIWDRGLIVQAVTPWKEMAEEEDAEFELRWRLVNENGSVVSFERTIQDDFHAWQKIYAANMTEKNALKGFLAVVGEYWSEEAHRELEDYIKRLAATKTVVSYHPYAKDNSFVCLRPEKYLGPSEWRTFYSIVQDYGGHYDGSTKITLLPRRMAPHALAKLEKHFDLHEEIGFTPEARAWLERLDRVYKRHSLEDLIVWAQANGYVASRYEPLPEDVVVKTTEVVEHFVAAQQSADLTPLDEENKRLHAAALVYSLELPDRDVNVPRIRFFKALKPRLLASPISFGGHAPPCRGVRLDLRNSLNEKHRRRLWEIVIEFQGSWNLQDPFGRQFIFIPQRTYHTAAATMWREQYEITEIKIGPPALDVWSMRNRLLRAVQTAVGYNDNHPLEVTPSTKTLNKIHRAVAEIAAAVESESPHLPAQRAAKLKQAALNKFAETVLSWCEGLALPDVDSYATQADGFKTKQLTFLWRAATTQTIDVSALYRRILREPMQEGKLPWLDRSDTKPPIYRIDVDLLRTAVRENSQSK